MLRCKIQRMAILLLLWGVAPAVFAQSVDITGRTLSTLTDQALNGVPASGDAANSSQASGSAAVASQNNQTLPDLDFLYLLAPFPSCNQTLDSLYYQGDRRF